MVNQLLWAIVPHSQSMASSIHNYSPHCSLNHHNPSLSCIYPVSNLRNHNLNWQDSFEFSLLHIPYTPPIHTPLTLPLHLFHTPLNTPLHTPLTPPLHISLILYPTPPCTHHISPFTHPKITSHTYLHPSLTPTLPLSSLHSSSLTPNLNALESNDVSYSF